MVRTKLIGILALLLNIHVLILQVKSQSEITIGTGTSTTGFIPISRQYNYSVCEAIYLNSEIEISGEITKLRFYKSNSDDASDISATKIYIKTTSSNMLSNGNYNLTSYTEVFDGTFTNSSGTGWKEIILQTPFNYNNLQNLSILILHDYQFNTSNSPLWNYNTTSSTLCRYDYSNSKQPTKLNASAERPNIQLVLNCYKPVANAGADTSICNSINITIGGIPSASGGSASNYTYNWTPSTSLSSTTDANPTTSTTVSTTYSLVVTDGSGCKSDTSKLKVYVSGASTTYIANNSMTHHVTGGTYYDGGGLLGDYYNNQDVTQTFYPCEVSRKLKFTFTNFNLEQKANCNNDYLSIYDGPSTSSPLIGKYCGTANPGTKISTHSSGALTFKFHSNEITSTTGWEASISYECIPIIAYAGSDTTICFGDTITLGASSSITGGTNYLNYHWEPSYWLSSSITKNPSASPQVTTSYILILDDTICGTDADTVMVSVLQIPDAFAGNDTIIMVGSSVNIGTQNPVPQVNYQWNPVSGLDLVNISGPVANPDSTIQYTLVTSNLCGSDTDQVLINVKYQLDVSYVVTNETFDSGSSITLNLTGGESPYTFIWESTYFGEITDSIFDTTYVGYYENLTPGYYAVNVIDASQQSVRLNFVIGVESVWEYYNGVQISNENIKKTSEDGWNTGVVQSINRLDKNIDGAIEFKIADVSTKMAFGFRDIDNPDKDGYTGLSLGFIIENGNINIYEEGVLIPNITTIQNEDLLKIERRNNKVYYLKNELIIRKQTINNLNTRLLGVQAGLFFKGSIINNPPPALISRDDPFFPIFTIKKDYFTCKTGDYDGKEKITIFKNGGYGFKNYTYQWSKFENGTITILNEITNVLSNVSPGWYQVRVTVSNSSGQQFIRTFNILFGYNILWMAQYESAVLENHWAESPPYIKKISLNGIENHSGFNTKDYSIMRQFKNGWVGNIVHQKGGQIRKAFGLSKKQSDGIVDEIDYAFVYNNNILEIRENGELKYQGSFSINDVLIISREGYKIKYWKNGVLLRQASTDPEIRLMVDGSIYNKGGYFKDIVSDFCNDKCDKDIYSIIPKENIHYGIKKPFIYYLCSGNRFNINFTEYLKEIGKIIEITPTQNVQIINGLQLEFKPQTSITYQVAFNINGCISYLQIAINVIDCTPAENNGIVLNNFGARIIITEDYSVNVYGSIYNSNGGASYIKPPSNPIDPFERSNNPCWYNEGLIQFTKNWTNNSNITDNRNSHVFADIKLNDVTYVTKGEVRTIGDYQKIKGTNYTQFYNLTLTNYGKKEQFVDARVTNILDLVNSELDVNNYTMYIDNTEASAIHKNAGYVVTHTEPDKQGWLERAFNDNKKRIFPVAGYNSSEQLRYRPVEIEVETGGNNNFKVMCVHDNPTDFEQRIAANIEVLNDKFYHAIQQTYPAAIPANITIYYDEAVDGHFQSMAHLDDVSTIYPPTGAPVWKTASNFNFSNNAGINSSVTISGWNDYVNDKFALTQAGITINTDDYNDGSNTFGITGPYNNGDPYDPSLNTGQTNNTGSDVNIIPEVIPVAGEDNHYIITVNPGSENTGVSINLEIDNSLTIQNVTIEYDIDGDGTSEPYVLSSDLYEIVDGNVFILHANPKSFGPECLNNLKLSLKDGLVLTPQSSDGLFQNLEITGFNDITEISLKIIYKATGFTAYDAAGNALLSSPWDGKISNVYTPGLYEFELQITSAPGAVLKGQIIVE